MVGLLETLVVGSRSWGPEKRLGVPTLLFEIGELEVPYRGQRVFLKPRIDRERDLACKVEGDIHRLIDFRSEFPDSVRASPSLKHNFGCEGVIFVLPYISDGHYTFPGPGSES